MDDNRSFLQERKDSHKLKDLQKSARDFFNDRYYDPTKEGNHPRLGWVEVPTKSEAEKDGL